MVAATCTNCHGTMGRSNGATPEHRGFAKGPTWSSRCACFAKASGPATVMHQIARGYSDQQTEQLADYFSPPRRQNEKSHARQRQTVRRRLIKFATAGRSVVVDDGLRHDRRKQGARAKSWSSGAGYGGATAAKYLRIWSGGEIDVTPGRCRSRIRLLPDVEPGFLLAAERWPTWTVGFDGLRKTGNQGCDRHGDRHRWPTRNRCGSRPGARTRVRPACRVAWRRFRIRLVRRHGRCRARATVPARVEGRAADRRACGGNLKRCRMAASSSSVLHWRPTSARREPYETGVPNRLVPDAQTSRARRS